LGTEALSWRDLCVSVRHAPRESALARVVDPDQAEWSLTDYLLAIIADYQAWLVWSKSADGKRNRNRPKPIPRPGISEDREVQVIGSSPVPLDQLDAFIGWSVDDVPDIPKPPPRARDERGRFVKTT